jgi:hypothetical protein
MSGARAFKKSLSRIFIKDPKIKNDAIKKTNKQKKKLDQK